MIDLIRFKNSILLLSLILIQISSFATITTTTGSGSWFTSGNWDNGVPTCGDTVIISPGDTIIIHVNVNLDEASTPACSTAMYIEVSGVLGFQTGKKLYTPCGSAVYLTSTGLLLKGSGGGNSNLIEVCGTGIWNAGDGNVTGPQWIGAPLPVTLKFFKAEVESEVVRFNWVTLSEINNETFTIERSSDLKNTIDIISVPGAGNSRDELTYEAFDQNPMNGNQYYRLKQTDYDGATSYSNWVAINSDISVIQNVSVHPTLVQNEFHIRFFNQNESTALIYLHNSVGALISTQEIEITSDSFIWSSTDDLESLSGPMFLTVYINENKHQFKLIFN